MTASAIGYLPANRSVTVLDNQDVPADFALAESTVTTYHVSNMDLAVNKKGRWHTLKATMTIKDADGVPAPDGVTVTGTISREARTFLRGAETVGGVAVWTLKTDFVGTGYTVDVAGTDDGAGSTLDPSTGCPTLSITIADGATNSCGP